MAESGGAPARGLPRMDGDVIWEILLRLPAASIHRFRVVCKEWRRITTDGHFIAAYSKRRSPMPLFFYRRDFEGGVARVDLQAVNLAARKSLPVLRFADVPDPMAEGDHGHDALCFDPLEPGAAAAVGPDSLFRVEGSCDGILLLSYLDILYVCNPSTRHWARLPPIHREDGIVGFYARDPQGQGRVYRVLYQTGAREIEGSYWIRVLGPPGQDAVYEIGRPTSPGLPPDLDGVLLAGLRPAYEQAPTMVHGSLHWLPQIYLFQQINMIVMFDTAVEEFRWIRPPAVQDAWGGGHGQFDLPHTGAFQLLEIEGMLSMAIINDERTMIDVWVLHDHVNEEWVRRHRIDLPGAAITADIGYNEYGEPPVYIVSQELDVLVPCPQTLLQCDASGAVLHYHRRPDYWTICTPHLFQESFIMHAFLMRQGNDDGGPPLLHAPVPDFQEP